MVTVILLYYYAVSENIPPKITSVYEVIEEQRSNISARVRKKKNSRKPEHFRIEGKKPIEIS